jgi:hypothetical protein
MVGVDVGGWRKFDSRIWRYREFHGRHGGWRGGCRLFRRPELRWGVGGAWREIARVVAAAKQPKTGCSEELGPNRRHEAHSWPTK